MKRVIVATAALLAAACGGSSSSPITAQEARDAMPAASQAQISLPSGSQASNALVKRDASAELTAGQTAPYAADTIALAVAVNGSVGFWLDLVGDIVNTWPATTCAGDTCTWGPGSGVWDVNVYQLVVTKKGDQDFTWALQGYKKSDTTKTFITFISGEAFTTGVRHVGSGTVTFDLDAARTGLARLSNDPGAYGKIIAQYDNRTSANLAVQFLGAQDDSNPGTFDNTAYKFLATADGGDLQVASRNLTSQAVFTLHSRWTSTGAGRGDAAFKNGGDSVARSQCWGANNATPPFVLLFQQTSPADFDHTDLGDVSSCGAFSTAVPPTIEAP